MRPYRLKQMFIPRFISSCLDHITKSWSIIINLLGAFSLSGRLLLLLFRHSANSSISQDERLATSAKLATRFHLPRAIDVRLHVLKTDVAILTPETKGNSPSLLVGFSIQDEAMNVARSVPQGVHYHADVIYLLP